MYERFTDRARKVMQLANEEALRVNHEYIGTEHILLGLIKEGQGVAAHVLTNLGLDLDKIRQEVTKLIQPGADFVSIAKLPQTPRAKKAVEYAMEEARALNHKYVGSEHMLLGLLREEEGVAAQVLRNLSLTLEGVREAILSILGHSTTATPPDEPAAVETEDVPPGLRAAVAALNAEIDRLKSQMENTLAQQDFQSAAALRDRAHHLWQTKAAMIRYWIFRRTIDRSWLSSNSGTVLNLARIVQAQRCWEDLPKLADALEAAGCADAEILSHLRQPGKHSSQCWVVDVLLAHT